MAKKKQGGSKARTNKEWQELIKDRPYTTSEYVFSYIPVDIVCKVCNHEWRTTPNSLNQGSKCPVCSLRNRRRKNYPFMEEIREDYQEKIKLGKISARDKVPFICKKHGEYWQALYVHVEGSGCPLCSSTAMKTDYDFLDEVHPRDRKKIENGEVYARDRVTFICPKHGEYTKVLSTHVKGAMCIKCLGESQVKREYPFMHEIREDYQNKIRNGECRSRNKVPFICEKHGEYWQTLNAHTEGKGCPACALHSTVYSFHMFLNENYSGTILVNDRQQIAPLEIDFYLPKLKLGFEFNDIDTHNIERKTQDYHINKHLLTKEKGIRLFHIWDFEWNDDDKRKELQNKIIETINGALTFYDEEILYLHNDYESYLHLLDNYEVVELIEEKKYIRSRIYYTSGITKLRRKDDGN